MHFHICGLQTISWSVFQQLLFASFVMKIHVLKDYDIKRQCKTSHALQLSGIHSKMRNKKKTQLQNSLAQQQSLFSQHCSVC